jgi:Rha family phage regulatory protein
MAETTEKLSLAEAKDLISGADGRATVSSLEVADRFRKLHKNVLRNIESIECSEEFYRLNFEPLTYLDRRSLEQPMFKMTRDGFALLVMGFTGSQAMVWKERYIQAFNLMEAELARLSLERAEARGRSKTVRVAATDSYKAHGATDWFHYVNNTDAIYEIMFGGSARQLRKRWGLAATANIRDHLSTEQLDHVIQIENAVTIQLDHRKIFHPDDQLTIVRHVAKSYKIALEAPIPGLASGRAA